FAFVYFEDERDVEDAIMHLTIPRLDMTDASSQLNGLGVNAIDTVMDPSLCQGALGEIMADEVILLLGVQLVPTGEATINCLIMAAKLLHTLLDMVQGKSLVAFAVLCVMLKSSHQSPQCQIMVANFAYFSA
ncbi:hypothetical protein Tco_1466770, partial [Tanacetum coccineum]